MIVDDSPQVHARHSHFQSLQMGAAHGSGVVVVI
jgi:hypothetical protein